MLGSNLFWILKLFVDFNSKPHFLGKDSTGPKLVGLCILFSLCLQRDY